MLQTDRMSRDRSEADARFLLSKVQYVLTKLKWNKTAYVEQLVYLRERSTLTDMPIYIKTEQ